MPAKYFAAVRFDFDAEPKTHGPFSRREAREFQAKLYAENPDKCIIISWKAFTPK